MHVKTKKQKLVIATRRSPLALWQANHIKQRLEALHPNLTIELLPMVTQGDKFLESPLSKIGGKGLFIKELETALLSQHADIAVHSMKDVPVVLPEQLTIAVICQREDPRDALVSVGASKLDALPEGAIIGTTSLRRQSQLKARYPHFNMKNLRGNINTRLEKLDKGEYDAIILAASGLKRLNLVDRICEILTPEILLPANGQGVLGIEARTGDERIFELIQPLHHKPTATCLLAERALCSVLGGNCQLPLAAYGEITSTKTGKQQLHLQALVAKPDGQKVIRDELTGDLSEAESVGQQLAKKLLLQGADHILADIGSHS